MKIQEFELEQKRIQMVKSAFKTGLTSEETVKLSQELDEMLNVLIPPNKKQSHNHLLKSTLKK
ncbi:Spo0E like sporulation regulatory protein [Bacillus sp. THAF10]|uniref:aspartyl-phosphate phosphatase Spo0E family protein n=1 Tax=Bacillus sp. THAF10 TaxID=2587848 RepID=UPI001268BFB9|nr:aspartyl-phosphate phosphatase Spo0E family protein [Bacillus sp. THAF10]QFT88558.1 Spo0E like sporulation regulatory protein [Bacillus sp. THAF10]